MILYLMRHGQTDWNASGLVQGWKDTVLNAEGIAQSHAAAENLQKEKIEIIYASDLKRTRKSADIISAFLDIPVHYTKRLREMNFGQAEGIKKSDLGAKFSYTYQAFNDLKNKERYDVSYPDGETIGEVQQRFMKFAGKLWEGQEHKKILIVTHGMLIRIFTEMCLKKTIRLNNGSVLKITYDEKSKKFKSPEILF